MSLREYRRLQPQARYFSRLQKILRAWNTSVPAASMVPFLPLSMQPSCDSITPLYMSEAHSSCKIRTDAILPSRVGSVAFPTAFAGGSFAGAPLVSASQAFTPEPLSTRLDIIGALISSACAVHCLFLPVLIGFLPLFGLQILAQESFELGVLTFTLILASTSLVLGARQHAYWQILLFIPFAAGLFLFSHGAAGHDYHHILMALGGGVLATGHIVNRILCKRKIGCSCCKCTASV